MAKPNARLYSLLSGDGAGVRTRSDPSEIGLEVRRELQDGSMPVCLKLVGALTPDGILVVTVWGGKDVIISRSLETAEKL